jgi:CYTH domain-containing protein
MPSELPKYARVERERRWLVAAGAAPHFPLPFSRRLLDRYLDCGRLRLRAMVDSDGRPPRYKLSKKFASAALDAQPMVTIELTREEYDALLALPGHELVKVRRYDQVGGRQVAFDTFEGPLAGLVTCEIEADSAEELAQIEAPPYALREVTHDPLFAGGHLARCGSPIELTRPQL